MSILEEFNESPVSRRSFITRTAMAVGGALVVGIELDRSTPWANAADSVATAGGNVGVYVSIAPDETITLVCPGAEMGQGIATSLPMILAEHLMVDWNKVTMRLGEANDAFKRPSDYKTLGTSQSSGGSNSVRSYYPYLKHLGAKIRLAMLTAATTYNSGSYALSDLKVVNGEVLRVSDSGLVATYGQLATAAAGLTISDSDPNITYVQPADFKIIGQRKARLDIPAKVNGTAEFGIDVRRPGMVYASVVQAPKIGQSVLSVGTPPAGVKVVILSDENGVQNAVAAVHPRSTWDAIRAARSLSVTWQDAPYTADMDTTLLKNKFVGLTTADIAPLLTSGQAYEDSAKAVGDARGKLADSNVAGTLYNATYSVPYVNHVTMEPMNTTAVVNVDGSNNPVSAEVWSPTQTQVSATSPGARDQVVAVTGLTAANVTLHTTFLGGGFGRRLKTDYVRQAIQVANDPAMRGTPVKLVWSREEDFTHDFHRPASVTKFDAKMDNGQVVAFKARVVGGRTSNKAVTALSSSAVDGISNALYNFPNRLTEWIDDQAQVPVASWRSVGNSQNCFFLESFMDELAAAAGVDPITFRINHLDASGNGQRAINVLNRLRTESGWDTAPPSGRQRGVALSMSFGDTVCAQVAEVSGTAATGYKIWKVTVVIDPFSVINPDTVEAQIESAVIMGLGTAMYNQQMLSAGAVTRRNFDTYRMIRLREAPVEIKTIIMETDQTKKGGVGEPGLPPIAPAVANAIAKLNGTRLRDLPFAPTTTPPPPSAPTITSFTPTSGKRGSSVTITGTGFSNVSAVRFNGTSASYNVVNSTTITATVPNGATTGKITVVASAGTATSASDFTVVLAPTITSFTPTSGLVGAVITINGTNFSGATAVAFGGVAAGSFTVVSATQITATVPSGAATGSISVTTPGGTASRSTFTVTGAPTISGFTPSSGRSGTVVTISGTGFTGATQVTVGGVAAPTFTVVSSTRITVTIWAGAASGKIGVTTPKGSVLSKNSFSKG